MKRNILILLFVIGLVALEYGCKHDTPVTDKEQPEPICDHTKFMSVTDILYDPSILAANKDTLYEVDEGQEVNYQDLIIRFICKTEFVQLDVPSTNSSAYAVIADPQTVCWDLKSLKIEGLSKNGVIDLTSHFSLSTNYEGLYPFPIKNDDDFKKRVLAGASYSSVFLSLTIHKPFTSQEMMPLLVKFENGNGHQFGFTTAAFTIKK